MVPRAAVAVSSAPLYTCSSGASLARLRVNTTARRPPATWPTKRGNHRSNEESVKHGEVAVAALDSDSAMEEECGVWGVEGEGERYSEA